MVAFKKSFKHMASQYPVYGLHTGLASSDEWWRLLIEGCLRHCNVDEADIRQFVVPLGDSLLRRFETAEAYKIVEDVLPTLKNISSLHQRSSTAVQRPIQMSLATNSDRRILSACKALGLSEFLDLDVRPDPVRAPTNVAVESARRSSMTGPTLSYDVGFEKPDKRFFHAVVQRAFPDPDENDLDRMCGQTLYVGDHFQEDYRGARQAGLQSAWLRRQQSLPTAIDDIGLAKQAEQDGAALNSLNELVGFIENSWRENVSK